MQYVCMIISILGLLIGPFLHPSSVSASADNSLYISGFKVSSTSEYVEIVNDGAVDIDVSGWVIEYSNSSGSNIKKVATLSGIMPVGAYETYVSSAFITAYPQDPVLKLRTMEYSGLADSGGYLRLKQLTTDLANYPDGYIKIDEVGWVASTTASTNPTIINYSGTVALHRCTDALGEYVARGDNRTDFYTSELPTLQAQGEPCADLVVVDPPDESDDDEEIIEPPEEPPLTTCAGIVINEVLPNPAGADQGNEFIELYNPTDARVTISGCSIEDSEGNSYTFSTSETIEPRTWMKLSDTDMGITLVNSKQQTIYLLGQDMSEASSATYPADLEDNQSWALFDDTYAATYTPTPELPNILTVFKPCEAGYVRNTQSGRCTLESSGIDSPLSQCQAGYERNPDTNRCRRVTSSVSVCPEGQTRNPQTNRCRSEQTTAVLAACATGQERNPETNRCRKIDTQTELMPCAVGQERNPETNRCRSVLPTLDTSTSEIGDVVAQNTASALPIGMIAAGSAGYVVYEWRPELAERLRSAWSKLRKK